MADMDDNLKKAKEYVQDSIKKVQENETVSNVVDSINNSEYTQKVKATANGAIQVAKKNKYYKYIRVVAIFLAVFVLFRLFFGGEKREATQFAESEIAQTYKDSDYKKIKTSAKYVGKVNNIYIIDVTVSGLDFARQKFKSGEICIVQVNNKYLELGLTREYYDKDGRKQALEFVKAYLASRT